MALPLSEKDFGLIKEYLKTHTKAETTRKFKFSGATVMKVDRCVDYEEYFRHRKEPKYFALQSIEEILAEDGKLPKNLTEVEKFNNEWYFDPKYQQGE